MLNARCGRNVIFVRSATAKETRGLASVDHMTGCGSCVHDFALAGASKRFAEPQDKPVGDVNWGAGGFLDPGASNICTEFERS